MGLRLFIAKTLLDDLGGQSSRFANGPNRTAHRNARRGCGSSDLAAGRKIDADHGDTPPRLRGKIHSFSWVNLTRIRRSVSDLLCMSNLAHAFI